MLRIMSKAKIHRATVTDANLQYMGSITIDKNLLEEADIYPSERVQVVNVNNGSRIETYVIEGEAGSGIVCINGPAARWAQTGDLVIIISYCLFTNEEAAVHKQKTVFVDDKNRIIKRELKAKENAKKRR
jgi:aspartate 1-decarboxylase